MVGGSELFREIWQTARRNKLRTGLTGFSVAWGIFMLIVLLGAGNGLINAQLKQSERFLSSSMMVFGGETSKPYQGLKEGRYVPLQTSDIGITEREFKENIDEVGTQYRTSATISLGQQFITEQLMGVYPNHIKIEKNDMLHGRFINAIDLREQRKVLVLSDKQARELLGAASASGAAKMQSGTAKMQPDAAKMQSSDRLVGRYVNVGNFSFLVVGIYKESENGWARVYAPYSTIKRIFGSHSNDAGNIEFTFHGLSTEAANEHFESRYRQRLNANHQVHPDDEGALWLWNRYTENMQMTRGLGYLRLSLWVVGLFTLLSGIVGVSNIMLITVKERTHEFGIRKAIGARPWSILRLIIVESIVITTLFGYVGMVLGVAANEWMDATLGHDTIDTGLFKATMFVDPTVGIDVCVEATAVMVIAGTIAGLIPAYKASRIRPIEALRAE